MESIDKSALSGGEPLQDSERAFFESQMNADGSRMNTDGTRIHTDFSDVRVHTDKAANESAESINADAYTVGTDIVFGEDKYQPGTKDGSMLMAHELGHVGQQKVSGKAVVQRKANIDEWKRLPAGLGFYDYLYMLYKDKVSGPTDPKVQQYANETLSKLVKLNNMKNGEEFKKHAEARDRDLILSFNSKLLSKQTSNQHYTPEQLATISGVGGSQLIGGALDHLYGNSSKQPTGDIEFAPASLNYKQFDKKWKDVSLYSNNSSLRAIGCVVSVYGMMIGKTPKETDEILDNMISNTGKYKGGYGGHRPDYQRQYNVGQNEMLINHFAHASQKKLAAAKGTDAEMRTFIDNNVKSKILSEIRFAGHSVLLSGARYDTNGSITHYLIRDPGAGTNAAIPRNTLIHSRWGKIKLLRWLY